MTNLALIENGTLSVADIGGELVVDSRLIAAQLGIQHETVIKSIRKYSGSFQQMGNLRFEIGTSAPNANGAQHQVTFAYLNELQSSFLMTLSKNTRQVVSCKQNLVTAFDTAKQIIKTVIPAQNDRIRELELMIRLADSEADRARAEQRLIDTRDAILKFQPPAVAAMTLGLPLIPGEVKTRTVVVDQMGNVVNAGDTLTKTQIAHELGFVNSKGKAETKQVANLVDEAIRDGAIPMPWRDERTVIATGFDAELLPKLKAYYQASPAQRQRWMGEN